MKLKHLLFLIFLFSLSAQAQDMIITQYGDTINRKIIYSTKRYLFYVDSNYYGKYYVKGIKKKRMTTSQMNVYKVDRNTAMMNQRAKDVMGNSFMLQGGIQLGFLPLFADSTDPSSWKKFLGDLRICFSYNASIYLRLRPHSLVGLVVDDSHSSAFASKLEIPQGENKPPINATDVKSSIGMFYFGPEYMFFKDSKKFRHFFILSGGIGYTRFNWVIRPGNSPGFNYKATGIGIRFSIAKTWAVGRTVIIGPNFKFIIAGIADESGFAGIVPRVNLGLSVLLH